MAVVNKENKIDLFGSVSKDKEIVKQWEDIISVAVTNQYVIGLKKDGNVVITPGSRQPDMRRWTNIVEIAGGKNGFAGLKANGTVVSSENIYTKANWNVVENWKDIISICVTEFDVYGLKKDGTVVGTGDADMKGWTNIAMLTSSQGGLVGLKRNNTVIAQSEGLYPSAAKKVRKWRNIVHISAGGPGYKDGRFCMGWIVGLNSIGRFKTNNIKLDDIFKRRKILDLPHNTYHLLGIDENGAILYQEGNRGDGERGMDEIKGYKNILWYSQ